MKKIAAAVLVVGCSQGTSGKTPDPVTPAVPAAPTAAQLANRAYVVCRDSDDLLVIDLDKLELVGRGNMRTQTAHMAEIGGKDFSELYVSSTETNEIVVVDTRDLQVKSRIGVGRNPTHTTMLSGNELLAVMDEGDDAVSVVDLAARAEKKRIGGFKLPHFLRVGADGKHAFVANLKGNTVTRVDIDSLSIVDQIALDGVDPNAELDKEEGFADAQIDESGVMYAAHAGTGRVLTYDTRAGTKLPELTVGTHPWIVFADHHFAGMPQRHLVPNFGDLTVSLIDGVNRAVVAAVEGDKEAYGVNYSPLAPDRAYVMNRARHDIAVVDTRTRTILDRIAVGGNTETASTSADGKYIVAAVSSANRVVVIEAATGETVKTFDDMGVYPWSLVIPRGQNYCH
jgi:YVTN family beta-propeller protein